MATNYTTLLGLALPTTGELDGTWGTTVNNSITELVEDAIAETATADVTSGDWILTTTGSGAGNQARCAILIPYGTPGATKNIIAPAKSKAYYVINNSDASVVVKTSGSTGVTIPAGAKATVAYDKTPEVEDFVEIAPTGTGGTVTSVNVVGGTTGLSPTGGPITSSGNITLAGTLNVSSGGTGRTSLAANNVVLGNGTSQVQLVAPGSDGEVLMSNGSTWGSEALGSMATQNSGSVSITGGSISGLSSLSTNGDVTITTGTVIASDIEFSDNKTSIGGTSTTMYFYTNNALWLNTTNTSGSGGPVVVGCYVDWTPPTSEDGNKKLGDSNKRWSTVYAVTGTINTSDRNEKNSIYNSDKGLSFINQLRPVKFKYNFSGNVDAEGNKTPGVRYHYGLIAQEVKEVIGDANDFAGWIKGDVNDPNSVEGLRYDQFIAPLIKAVQELSAEVEALKAQINGG